MLKAIKPNYRSYGLGGLCRVAVLTACFEPTGLARAGNAGAPNPAAASTRSSDACRDPSASSPAKDGAQPFDLGGDRDFAQYEVAIRRYAARFTKQRADFCVIGFAHAQDWRKAWVIWPRRRRIFSWAGGAAELERGIDMKTDVVASEDEIKGSTYLVTREWVNRLVSACACFGRQVHIKPAAQKDKP